MERQLFLCYFRGGLIKISQVAFDRQNALQSTLTVCRHWGWKLEQLTASHYCAFVRAEET